MSYVRKLLGRFEAESGAEVNIASFTNIPRAYRHLYAIGMIWANNAGSTNVAMRCYTVAAASSLHNTTDAGAEQSYTNGIFTTSLIARPNGVGTNDASGLYYSANGIAPTCFIFHHFLHSLNRLGTDTFSQKVTQMEYMTPTGSNTAYMTTSNWMASSSFDFNTATGNYDVQFQLSIGTFGAATPSSVIELYGVIGF